MRFARNKDMSIVWTCFLMKIVGLWLAADQAEQRRRKFTLIYTINAITIATCIALRDFYYSWGNFSDCVYIAGNISYLTIVYFKIFVLYAHREEFFHLVRLTQKNFWHSDYSIEEKLILDNCRKFCGIFIVVISFCTQGTCAGYMITPIIANIGNNESERVLPFNMWVDFPTGMSPYFEILFTIQVLCVYHVGICYICFDNFLYIVNLHVASQFRILRYRVVKLNEAITVKRRTDDTVANENLCSYMKICYEKMRDCVRQHQMLTDYCQQLENVFSIIILGQVLFLSMIICLVGYQMFLAETPPSRSAGLILNMAGMMAQLLMFTYSCDGLIQQSASVGTAVFSGPWATFPMNETGKKFRKNILIIILRSRKSCCLTASGYFPVSLETYTGVLSTAMSYFTLLRHSSIDTAKM